MTVTVADLKQWCKDNTRAAETVFLAMAHAQLTRERVESYIEPILAEFAFTYDITAPTDPKHKQPITRAKDLYCSNANDETLGRFYRACHAAHIDHGYAADVRDEPGRCPALVAESLQRSAERVLIELATPLFGIEAGQLYGDKYRKYLDLLLTACTKEMKGNGRDLMARHQIGGAR